MLHSLPLHIEGTLLNRQPTGEKFLHLTLLSSKHGLCHAGKRISSRPGTPLPDLFDEAALILDPPRQGAAALRFVREYRILRRHDALGRNYRALSFACRYARILADNPLPETSAPQIHSTLKTALAAWETPAPPETVFFKALFLLARDEGLPVKEDWYPGLSLSEREAARQLLKLPASRITLDRPRCERLIARLENYLQSEHDLRIPA